MQAIQRKVGRLAAAALLVALVAVESGPANADVGMSTAAPVVVELFTSQGCNSCPPADALLEELSNQPGIITLSMHVDYWDYIGWHDPYASPVMTGRQQSYAKSLRSPYVYTPQILVDGQVHLVGSHRDKVRQAIDKAAKRGKPVDVQVIQNGGDKILIPAGHAPDDGATVWLAIYDGVHETDVRKGENAGQAIRNVHVVRELVDLGTWIGEAMEIPLDLSAAAAQGRAGCAVLVQQGRTGPILGAAVIHIGG
jgi:hypothetical protein